MQEPKNPELRPEISTARDAREAPYLVEPCPSGRPLYPFFEPNNNLTKTKRVAMNQRGDFLPPIVKANILLLQPAQLDLEASPI